MQISISNTETLILDTDARIIAEQCVHGSYQAALVAGRQRWSGADLRGVAGTYGARYAASRKRLLRALHAALYVYEVDGGHGRRVMILSSDPVIVEAGGAHSSRYITVREAPIATAAA